METRENAQNKDKRRQEDKRSKSPKKLKDMPMENKGPLPRYTNYHSLTAPLDHIYVVTNRSLYRSPEPMEGDRAQRDIKQNCAFHKDIRQTTNRCVSLKDELERLIRVGHFKEFVREPQIANREERPHQRSPERVREVLTIIGGPYLFGESCSTQERYAKDAKTHPPVYIHKSKDRPSKQG